MTDKVIPFPKIEPVPVVGDDITEGFMLCPFCENEDGEFAVNVDMTRGMPKIIEVVCLNTQCCARIPVVRGVMQ